MAELPFSILDYSGVLTGALLPNILPGNIGGCFLAGLRGCLLAVLYTPAGICALGTVLPRIQGIRDPGIVLPRIQGISSTWTLL